MRASRAKVAALHDTATTVGTCACGELARLRLGALARRIEHHGIEPLELGRHERPAEQVARLIASTGFSPGVACAARCQRLDRGSHRCRRR